jgi:hypothetical protein
MNSDQGLVAAGLALLATMFAVTVFYARHMAGLYDRIHELERRVARPVNVASIPELNSAEPESAGWTIETSYGGAWIVRNEHGREVAGGMSQSDARHNAREAADRLGLPEQALRRIYFDWE